MQVTPTSGRGFLSSKRVESPVRFGESQRFGHPGNNPVADALDWKTVRHSVFRLILATLLYFLPHYSLVVYGNLLSLREGLHHPTERFP